PGPAFLRPHKSSIEFTQAGRGSGGPPHHVSRRRFLNAAGVLAVIARRSAAMETSRQATVAVVYVSGVEAYAEAVGGLKEKFARALPEPAYIDLKTNQTEALAEAQRMSADRLVIAVGSEALTAAAAMKGAAVVMPTMILRWDWPAGAQNALAGR